MNEVRRDITDEDTMLGADDPKKANTLPILEAVERWRRERAENVSGHKPRRRDYERASKRPAPSPTRALSTDSARRLAPISSDVATASPLLLAPSVSLRELLAIVGRRKWILINVVVGLLTLATIAVFQMTPRYTAQAFVMIEGQENINLGLQGLQQHTTPELRMGQDTLESEMEVMRSRSLAGRLVDRLQLHLDPEFNSTLAPKSRSQIAAFLEQFKEWRQSIFGPPAEKKAESEELLHSRERVRVIDAFLDRLRVFPVGGSRVIGIEFTSKDDVKAAYIANGMSDLYVTQRLDAKFETTRQATTWLDERIAALREQVQTSEKAIEKFRQDHGLLQGREGSLIAQEISELNTQLVQAKAERSAAEVRLRQAKGLVNSPGGVDSVTGVLQSALIQRLREQEAELGQKAAELSEQLGERHPAMVQLQAQRRDFQSKIKAEIGKIISALQHETDIARARESTLQSRLKDLEVQVANSNSRDVDLRALQREADAARELLQSFLAKAKETGSQQDLRVQRADVRVISRADVPESPSFPNKKLILALVFIVSLFIAFVVIYIKEELDPSFRSVERLEQATGAPALGIVPKVGRLRNIGQRIESQIIEHPTSAISESFRNLYMNILARADRPPRTLMVVSSKPKEGKTTTAVCLARLHALGGHKVVVVDADIRRPGVHGIFRIDREPGLVEFLAEEAALDDVIRQDAASDAYAICAGRPVANLNYHNSAEAMDKLLEELSSRFDLVIVDTPPLMEVSDACILSRKVDTTIYVTRWAATPREAVRQGIKQIAASGGHLGGIVLTMVDAKARAGYGSADPGAYYGRPFEA